VVWSLTSLRTGITATLIGAAQLGVLLAQLPQLLQPLRGQPVIAFAAVGLILTDPGLIAPGG
jgi:hypothetical protein